MIGPLDDRRTLAGRSATDIHHIATIPVYQIIVAITCGLNTPLLAVTTGVRVDDNSRTLTSRTPAHIQRQTIGVVGNLVVATPNRRNIPVLVCAAIIAPLVLLCARPLEGRILQYHITVVIDELV